jgi:hypothetical protein
MQCKCGWEGELATVTHMDKGWQFTSEPMCIRCRLDHRMALRKRGITKFRVVPCRT